MKALKIILGAVAALNLIAVLALKRIDSSGKIVLIGALNTEYIWAIVSFLLWLSVVGIMILFFTEKDEKKKSRSTIAGAVCVLPSLVLTLVMLGGMLSAFAARGDYRRIKSPDGEHYIVRKETSDVFGHKNYKFYIKDKGIVYRYIFDSDEAEPELKWTSSGVKYKKKLYRY